MIIISKVIMAKKRKDFWQRLKSPGIGFYDRRNKEVVDADHSPGEGKMLGKEQSQIIIKGVVTYEGVLKEDCVCEDVVWSPHEVTEPITFLLFGWLCPRAHHSAWHTTNSPSSAAWPASPGSGFLLVSAMLCRWALINSLLRICHWRTLTYVLPI